jgi:thiamine-phosphate pyrophosphorylase
MEVERASQLYAVLEAGEDALARLQAALDATPIASVLIRPAAGASLDAGSTKPLVDLAQTGNAAALLAGDAQLARTLRADGVHLDAGKDLAATYEQARGIIGDRGIVGVDVGISRHDAMALAEAGADYIAFGAPAHLNDRDKGRARRDELVAWWAEIFEVPCVVFDVETGEEAERLTRAGAEFVAVELSAGATAAATGDLVTGIAGALSVPETTG